jgi:hypothetical protein
VFRGTILVFLSAIVASTAAGSITSGHRAAVHCSNLRHAAEVGMVRKGGLRGDVTGDGVTDRVMVVEDRHAAFRCRFAIGVFSRGRLLLRPLGRFIDKPSEAIGGPWPLIRLLARIDRRPGAEILAAVSRGASFEQAQLLAVHHGRLGRIRFPGSYRGVFSYGSIIPAGESFDCLRSDAGTILAAAFTSLDAKGRRWRYALTSYRVDGIVLRRTGVRSTVRVGNATRPPAWWSRYYDDSFPFRHCTVVRRKGQ